MLEYIIIALIGLIVLAAVAAVALLLRGRKQLTTAQASAWQLLQQQVTTATAQQDQRLNQLNTTLASLTKQLNDQLTQGHSLSQQAQKLINDRLETAGKTLSELKGQLGELSQATRNIAQVGTEVRKLQDVLQSPKLRGSLGEWTLENLLAAVLPQDHYQLQHHFNDGTIVDALVKLAQGSVAIDAKFPLANFQLMLEADQEPARQKARRAFLKDVCKHIDEIAQKYILPEEGTLDFALMYIPAENVYYEATIVTGDNEPDVSAYGREHKVVPVSPNTLYAYLMVVATGLKGLQIEKNAQVIRRQLTQLSTDIEGFIGDFAIVGKHINNALAKHHEASKRLDYLQLRLQQMETDASDQNSS